MKLLVIAGLVVFITIVSIVIRDVWNYHVSIDNATIEKLGDMDYRITMGGRKYRGDCTVWHSEPDGRRCGTFLEGDLNGIWQSQKWKEKDRKR